MYIRQLYPHLTVTFRQLSEACSPGVPEFGKDLEEQHVNEY